jgi:quaternary ammonium compound-resistance protein SugE
MTLDAIPTPPMLWEMTDLVRITDEFQEPNNMAWLFILLAGAFEMTWPFVLKWLTKFPSATRWSPLLVVVLFAIPICYLLAESLKHLPAATVYATFVGIGTAGTAIIGMLFFGESTSLGRVCSLVLLLAGLIGLKAFSVAAE